MGIHNMTDRRYALERDVVEIYGRCTGAGAANPTAVKGKGIVSITRSGVGLYTITLDTPWMALLDFNPIVVGPTATGHWEVNVVSETLSSTKTINIAVWGAATATAPALKDLTAAERLQFTITASNSTQVPLGY